MTGKSGRMTAALAMACVTIWGTAQAQVRREPAEYGISAGAVEDISRMFASGGLFLVAGGVVLHGSTLFEHEGEGSTRAVPASAVTPRLGPDGALMLVDSGVGYRLPLSPGLACPLGRFVQRGGLLAYTVPRFLTADMIPTLVHAGVVHHRVAREFDGTPYEALLHAADFAATEDLAPALEMRVLSGINASNGVDAVALQAASTDQPLVGSYINADPQVTYRVYLSDPTHTAEIGGVPLRYYWRWDHGWAAVFGVQAFAQNWKPGTTLTDLTRPGATPTQYDVVNLYQTAALFRTLDHTAPEAFDAFVQAACAGTR
jgi:hypothetical protein